MWTEEKTTGKEGRIARRTSGGVRAAIEQDYRRTGSRTEGRGEISKPSKKGEKAPKISHDHKQKSQNLLKMEYEKSRPVRKRTRSHLTGVEKPRLPGKKAG